MAQTGGMVAPMGNMTGVFTSMQQAVTQTGPAVLQTHQAEPHTFPTMSPFSQHPAQTQSPLTMGAGQSKNTIENYHIYAGHFFEFSNEQHKIND